jgi:hypothetical protein
MKNNPEKRTLTPSQKQQKTIDTIPKTKTGVEFGNACILLSFCP